MYKTAAEIKAYNHAFADMIEEGQVKQASVSTQSFTRDRLREESFTEHILTPQDITNEDLDKAEDPELLIKWNEREPDSSPAINVPYGTSPSSRQFTGTRYPSYFGRIMSEKETKDIDKLRGFTYDIRKVLMDQHTKNIAAIVDSNFLNTCSLYIGTQNTANALNGLGLPQNVSFAGGITRENFAEAKKVIMRLQVPFSESQPDGNGSKGVMLMNNVTSQDFVKMGLTEVGGQLAEQTWIDGMPSKTLLGIKPVYTLKYNLVPDGVIWFFSSEEFLGKYYRLHPLTVFMKTEAFYLEFFQYINLSISIGNAKGVCKISFLG